MRLCAHQCWELQLFGEIVQINVFRVIQQMPNYLVNINHHDLRPWASISLWAMSAHCGGPIGSVRAQNLTHKPPEHPCMSSILLQTWPIVVAILISALHWTHVARPWALLPSALFVSLGVRRVVTCAVSMFPQIALGAQIAKVDTTNAS